MAAANGWRSRWEELSGDGGLSSKHWRTRLAALHSLLADDTFPFDRNIHAQLLDLLIFTLALSDTHYLVRKTATICASKVFTTIQKSLSISESDHYLWGFLATSMDEEIEVQNAARESLLEKDTTHEMAVRLVQKFVARAMLCIRSLDKRASTAAYEGFKFPGDLTVLLPALEGAVHLHLLCTSKPGAIKIETGPNLVQLLVAALSALREEYEVSRDKSGAKRVSRLLRSLGHSEHRQDVVSMLASKHYEGVSIARWHKVSGSIDDDVADAFEKLDTVLILKGVTIALESQDPLNVSPQRANKDPTLTNLEAQALRHIVEIMEIPSELISAIKETRNHHQVQEFVKSCAYYLRIADAILKGMQMDNNQADLFQGLLLRCAAMASPENDAETPLSWITIDLQELAIETVRNLGASLSHIDAQETQELAEKTFKAGNGVERLILGMLPDLIPKFKMQLRDYLNKDAQGNYGTPSNSMSLATSIVAAHQMFWCLKQVLHPHLGQLCTIIMPCALMALDHYSPHVKRQAMKMFIHLTNNLNPSELRWYKDVLLDCITRNIIGCGDLWPLVVRMTVPLVICIEGNNLRSRWYRNILNEMLSELERHQLDASRFKIWFQHINKVFEAMGLLLVAHFKRLLPLLFPWLHTKDDSMTLLVLDTLQVIIKHTWQRMPFHVERFYKELQEAYRDSFDKKSGSTIRSSVLGVCQLLQLCTGPAFEVACQKDKTDSSTSLVSALGHCVSGC